MVCTRGFLVVLLGVLVSSSIGCRRKGDRPGPADVAVEGDRTEGVAAVDRTAASFDDAEQGVSLAADRSDPTTGVEAINQIELDQELDALLHQLDSRQENIIRYRYGLEDGKAHTLEETGRRFNLTRERIRQIEKDSMRQLKNYVAEHSDEFKD